MSYSMEDLNQMNQIDFTEAIGTIFEHSSWIAAQAWKARPFSSISTLHETMVDIVKRSNMENKLDLLRAHPDLATRVRMTTESVQEQKGAGLDQLAEREQKEMLALNRTYTKKFYFPFIMAVRGQSANLIKTAMMKRMKNDRDTELDTALRETYKIAHFRLGDLIKHSHSKTN